MQHTTSPTHHTHCLLLVLLLNFMQAQLFSGLRTKFVRADRQPPQMVTAQLQLRFLLLRTL